MPPIRSATLTQAELRIMEALWQNGAGTVQQVLDWMAPKPALAYNSVLTTIRILEKKGYLEHSQDGRAYVYRPLVGRKQATQSEIRHLINRFFGNSHEELLLNILEERGLDAAEIEHLRHMLRRDAK